MTTKQEIEIEGLPEGWRAVAYRVPLSGDVSYNPHFQGLVDHKLNGSVAALIVQKIQPRRMVLELTEEELSLLRRIPVEQRLLKNPTMLDLITKIQILDKVKEGE